MVPASRSPPRAPPVGRRLWNQHCCRSRTLAATAEISIELATVSEKVAQYRELGGLARSKRRQLYRQHDIH